MKSWFHRWRRYPGSIAMHIGIWGAGGGALLALPLVWPAGIIVLVGYCAYEICSGVRHLTEDGHMDTIGLDIVDAVVGSVPAFIAVKIALEVLGHG